jgi:two-component system, response regulator, stage 0 sporulation protein F
LTESARSKILVVDDAGPVVILCVNVLQALGHAIKAANRGETAIDLVSKEPFDLLVVDYKMPGMNGFEVLGQARQIRPGMACMLMTAHGTPDIVDEATRLGFDYILLKPFTPSELRGAVDKVLTSRV